MVSEGEKEKSLYADIFGEKLQLGSCLERGKDDVPSITEKYTSEKDRVEIEHLKGHLLGYKIFFSKGGEAHYNTYSQKVEEISKDGIIKQFSNGKITREEHPNGTIITYYENGIISYKKNPDGSYIRNYEDGKLHQKGNSEDKSIFSYSPEGKLEYKIENKKLWYDPEYYSSFKIGMKTQDNDTHWTENFTLDPKKKTLMSYGGNGTKTPKAGNGNINANIYALGFTTEQQDNIQMLASYYFMNEEISQKMMYCRVSNWSECATNDIKREILKVFYPFIAQKTEHGWKQLPPNELMENMRNIFNMTHCYGTNEQVTVENVFYDEMQALGYSKDLISKALKQNLSITNNSQRDFEDKAKTTTLHRYSVCDGQEDRTYEYGTANSYPAHLENVAEFTQLKGYKSSFINTSRNEVLMIFDKILSDSTKSSSKEHNEAFFTTNPKYLTEVGKKQLKLIQAVAQWWYNNHGEVPNAENLIRQCGQDAELEVWTSKSFVAGKLLRKEHNNPFKNPHVLEAAKNRFNNPDIEPEHTGVWKLLQNTKQQRS